MKLLTLSNEHLEHLRGFFEHLQDTRQPATSGPRGGGASSPHDQVEAPSVRGELVEGAPAGKRNSAQLPAVATIGA